MGGERKGFILRADDISRNAFDFEHPLGGGGSKIRMSMLARPAGLKRVGVNLGRVPPGKEAFVFHRHHGEEEWVYIISGKAQSDIEGAVEEVAAGDFIAYPAGVAHSLKNNGDADLVYLMGGEQSRLEIADFPRHGKKMIRIGEENFLLDADAPAPFVPEIRPVDDKG